MEKEYLYIWKIMPYWGCREDIVHQGEMTYEEAEQWIQENQKPGQELEISDSGYNDELVPSDWWSGGIAENH